MTLENTKSIASAKSTSVLSLALSAFLAPNAARSQIARKAPASVVRDSAKRTDSTGALATCKARHGVPSAIEARLQQQTDALARIATHDSAPSVMISVIHSHLCNHCNRSYTCKSNPCLIENYDISKLHKCDEAIEYRKRMTVMLSYEPICKHNCNKPCNHPKLESNNQMAVSYVSRYSIDGLTNLKDTMLCQRVWHKAKMNSIADKFSETPWIAELAKDFRGK